MIIPGDDAENSYLDEDFGDTFEEIGHDDGEDLEEFEDDEGMGDEHLPKDSLSSIETRTSADGGIEMQDNDEVFVDSNATPCVLSPFHKNSPFIEELLDDNKGGDVQPNRIEASDLLMALKKLSYFQRQPSFLSPTIPANKNKQSKLRSQSEKIPKRNQDAELDSSSATVPISPFAGCNGGAFPVPPPTSSPAASEECKVPSPASPSEEKDAFGRAMAKGRHNWFTSEYGANFRLMGGELVPREFSRINRRATTNVKYIRELYKSDVSLAELETADGEKQIAWGSFFKGEKSEGGQNVWRVWTSQDDLLTLSTLDVQRNVAASINSRRQLQWALGVERNGMVTGCSLDRDERDILRQALDFALAREFVPELDPRLVKIEFQRVKGVTGERYLVLMTINDLPSTLHQLSSGRVFYLMGDSVVMADSMDQIRLALEERARQESAALSRKEGLGNGRKSGFAGLICMGAVAAVAGFAVGKVITKRA